MSETTKTHCTCGRKEELPPAGPKTITTQECPGSIRSNGENKHFLINYEGSKKFLCENGSCYFVYLENGVGVWQTGFDEITAKTFVKPVQEKKR